MQKEQKNVCALKFKQSTTLLRNNQLNISFKLDSRNIRVHVQPIKIQYTLQVNYKKGISKTVNGASTNYVTQF